MQLMLAGGHGLEGLSLLVQFQKLIDELPASLRIEPGTQGGQRFDAVAALEHEAYRAVKDEAAAPHLRSQPDSIDVASCGVREASLLLGHLPFGGQQASEVPHLLYALAADLDLPLRILQRDAARADKAIAEPSQ